jgi:hypothetical protein
VNPLEKIGGYDLVVTLIPGVILAEALRLYGCPLISWESVVPYAVVSYLLGLIASRLGSMLVAPVAQKISKKSFDYNNFVRAEKADPKIQTLLQTANAYRSFCGVAFAFFFIVISYEGVELLGLSEPVRLILVVSCMGILSFISYLKQRSYIAARVGISSDG